MEKPKSLDILFHHKIFRIPDYQRGYAWQKEQLKDFWEDLINLASDQSHYTGVLTLKQIPDKEINENLKENWLVNDHSYHVYQIVDGQQRLTTFIVFLQAFADLIRSFPNNTGKEDKNIFITDSLSLQVLQERFLFKTKPQGDQFRTYKFGYDSDNPSYNYMRYRIFDEVGGGLVKETFYTLNLSNAKTYFTEQLRDHYKKFDLIGLQDIYKKLTNKFLFNEYIIENDFDVYVSFETMNNRGKKLSDLELLKNRLIYITTIYNDKELDKAGKTSLRASINDAWREIYYQLGRNKSRPLNDDDFLRAHWIMYFKYSRQTGKDYIRFLLDDEFTTKRVQKKVEIKVLLDNPEEVRSHDEIEDIEYDNESSLPSTLEPTSSELSPLMIRNYVGSLKDSVVHWFNSFFPELDNQMSQDERQSVDCLNRLGMGYFRPLVMSIMKNEKEEKARVLIFSQIEKFIFVVFRLTSAMSNYGSSDFYNYARLLDQADKNLSHIENALNMRKSFTFNDDGTFRSSEFKNILFKKFKSGSGFYSWSGLKYFLYEYELDLLSKSVQQKIYWSDLLKNERDKISIEHIFPQTETPDWVKAFDGINATQRKYYSASIGNLLLLSMSINASLQNDSFEAKKNQKINSDGVLVRNGYAGGTHSEIEVSKNEKWGPNEIKIRGLKLLEFMASRWGFRFKDDDIEDLLFISFKDES